MRWLDSIRARVRLWLDHRASESRMDAEIRFHVEMEADQIVRTKGLSSDEARRQALLAFGGVETHKETLREGRGATWLLDAKRDIQYASRSLTRARGFAIVALLSLALGIGANAVIFSITDAALLRPLPYRDADRLVEFLRVAMTLDGDQMRVRMGGRRVDDLRTMPQVFEAVSSYSDPTAMALEDGADISLRVGAFAPEFPAFLGVAPQLGRDFTPDDVAAGDRVVISDSYWQRAFRRDPAVIGSTIPFAGGRRTVVGVMPPTFRYFVGGRTDAWLPIADRDGGQVVARLRPGLSVAQAQHDLDLALADPARTWKPLGVEILPADWNRAGEYFGQGVQATRVMLLSLLGAVGLLLAIGCANVANLLLSRTLSRQREIAVRLSLGASRGRVARQFLTEGLLLSGLGSVVGVLLAWWGITVLPTLVPPDLASAVFDVSRPALDIPVLGFAGVASVLTGLLCGSTSAAYAFSAGASTDLLAGGQRIAGPSRVQRRVQGVLQALQVAMTVILLSGAGLLLASVYRMATLPPGFTPENLGYASLSFPGAWSGSAGLAQRQAFVDELLARLQAVPGIVAATAGPPPIAGYSSGGFHPEGLDRSDLVDPRVDNYPVRPNYFAVAGMALVSGRTFDENDGSGAPPVAIISERTARRFWPGGSAIGRRFKQYASDDAEPWTTVVGVVADVRTINLMRDTVQVYRPSMQRSESSEILFRLSGDIPSGIALVRSIVRGIDSQVAVIAAGPVDGLYAERAPIRVTRFYALFISVFAGVALTTAAVGLYGALSYAVSQRTHELGVRMALGATASRVRLMVAGQILVPVIAGLIGGIVATLWLSRLIASQLFQVTPGDPSMIGGIVLLLLVTSAAAAAIPVRRAVRIEPAVSLRAE